MGRIAVHNEWSQLEEVVLGIAADFYWPERLPIDLEPLNTSWIPTLSAVLPPVLKRRPVPAWMGRHYVAELEALDRVLWEYGVTVHRPASIAPLPGEVPGLVQMFARDPLMAVGNVVIAGSLHLEMRRKEHRGLGSLLGDLAHEGARIVSVSADDTFVEGGDVLVDLPYVYVGIGKHASNWKGVEWLQSHLGADASVIPVPLAASGILHLDCCMTLVGPRLGIIHRGSLVNPLPPPLDSYEFIEVDARTRQELGTNVLALDPETVIVQSRHLQLQRDLRERGFRVLPLDFTSHARLGGAFRCATAPIRRCGSMG